jgi:hypothetical protein
MGSSEIIYFVLPAQSGGLMALKRCLLESVSHMSVPNNVGSLSQESCHGIYACTVSRAKIASATAAMRPCNSVPALNLAKPSSGVSLARSATSQK